MNSGQHARSGTTAPNARERSKPQNPRREKTTPKTAIQRPSQKKTRKRTRNKRGYGFPRKPRFSNKEKQPTTPTKTNLQNPNKHPPHQQTQRNYPTPKTPLTPTPKTPLPNPTKTKTLAGGQTRQKGPGHALQDNFKAPARHAVKRFLRKTPRCQTPGAPRTFKKRMNRGSGQWNAELQLGGPFHRAGFRSAAFGWATTAAKTPAARSTGAAGLRELRPACVACYPPKKLSRSGGRPLKQAARSRLPRTDHFVYHPSPSARINRLFSNKRGERPREPGAAQTKIDRPGRATVFASWGRRRVPAAPCANSKNRTLQCPRGRIKGKKNSPQIVEKKNAAPHIGQERICGPREKRNNKLRTPREHRAGLLRKLPRVSQRPSFTRKKKTRDLPPETNKFDLPSFDCPEAKTTQNRPRLARAIHNGLADKTGH